MTHKKFFVDLYKNKISSTQTMLSEEHIKAIEDGLSSGKNLETSINSLGIGTFFTIQTKLDNGDGNTSFCVTQNFLT